MRGILLNITSLSVCVVADERVNPQINYSSRNEGFY